MKIVSGVFAKKAGWQNLAIPAAFIGGAMALPPKVFYPMGLAYDTYRLTQPDRNVFDMLGAGLSLAGTYRAFNEEKPDKLSYLAWHPGRS